MRDVARDLRRWLAGRETVGLATVVATRFSAPRPVGSALALGPGGTIVGSVSGGCVESDVVAGLAEVAPGDAEVRTYGITDGQALAVGLACGGEIDVLLERLDATAAPVIDELVAALDADAPVALVTVVDGATSGAVVGARLAVRDDRVVGALGSAGLAAAAAEAARDLLALGRTAQRRLGPDGERRGDAVTLLVQSFAPRPRLLVYGAIDHAAALCRVGAFLGYRVTVCDARAAFTTPERFPDADEVVVAWPHRHLAQVDVDARTAVCVLTHDAKFDVPVLALALQGPAGYVGVLGSRRTQAERAHQLREAGVSEAQLARLRAPIGLDLGGRTPEETAIAIAAEIIADRHGASARPLGERDGPIHEATP